MLYQTKEGKGECSQEIEEKGKNDRDEYLRLTYGPGKNSWEERFPSEGDPSKRAVEMAYDIVRSVTDNTKSIGAWYHQDSDSSDIIKNTEADNANTRFPKPIGINNECSIEMKKGGSVIRFEGVEDKNIPANATNVQMAYVIHKVLGKKPPKFLAEAYEKDPLPKKQNQKGQPKGPKAMASAEVLLLRHRQREIEIA